MSKYKDRRLKKPYKASMEGKKKSPEDYGKRNVNNGALSQKLQHLEQSSKMKQVTPKSTRERMVSGWNVNKVPYKNPRR